MRKARTHQNVSPKTSTTVGGEEGWTGEKKNCYAQINQNLFSMHGDELYHGDTHNIIFTQHTQTARIYRSDVYTLTIIQDNTI